jgi:acyl-CoA synthetase (AMP-forming)/AMP-acid ligase II
VTETIPAVLRQAAERFGDLEAVVDDGVRCTYRAVLDRAAFVVPTSSHGIDPDEVIAWCREHMANFKVPRQVRVVETLPLNPSGKVMKFVLRDQLAAS